MLRTILGGCILLAASLTWAAEPAKTPEAVPAALGATDAIVEALARPVTLDFEDARLGAVAAYLAEKCRVPVLLDEAALEEANMGPDTPVSVHFSKLPLRSALRLMLRDLGLTYTVEGEALLITTPEGAEDRHTTRVYPVGDLLSRPEDETDAAQEMAQLARLIRSAVEPTSWREVGGWCAISPADLPGVRALVVSQTWRGHEEIAALLKSLRKAVGQANEGKTPDMIYLVPDTPATKAVRKALDRPVSFAFDEAPLEDVAAQLSKTGGINVLVDRRALEDGGLSPDTPITLSVKDLPLKLALKRLLQPLDLTYVIRDDAVLITAPEEAERQLSVAVYPVGDLVGGDDDSKARRRDLKALADVIRSNIQAHCWDTVGGPGSVTALTVAGTDMLVVAQTREVLAEVAALLESLRFVAERTTKGEIPAQVLLYGGRFEKNPPVEAILAALDKPAKFRFIETPLREVVAYVSRTYGINCLLDMPALGDVGIAEDTPITRHAWGVSLRSALRLMLRDLDLVVVIRDGALLITTPEEAEVATMIGVYPVGDLVGEGEQAAEGLERLSTVISTCIELTSWKETGGPGDITAVRLENIDALVILQSQEVHEEIAGLLKALRAAGRRAGGENEYEPILLYDGRYQENPAAERIRRVLRQKVNLDFDEVPLGDVTDFLRENYGIPCVLDQKSLDDVGLAYDTPVTIHVSGVTLGTALRLMLAQRDLSLTIRDEVLFFTTPEEAATMLVTGVYPVGDLAACRDEEGRFWDDYDSLAGVVVTVDPYSWDVTAAGPGEVVGGTFGQAKVLVVSQTLAVHEQIAELLGDLRAMARQPGAEAAPPQRSRKQPPKKETEEAAPTATDLSEARRRVPPATSGAPGGIADSLDRG